MHFQEISVACLKMSRHWCTMMMAMKQIMTIVTPEQAPRRIVTEGLQLRVFQWPYKSDDSSIISLRIQIFSII